MPVKVTGLVYVRVNGKLLRSKEGAKLNNPGGKEREAVIGNSVYGFSEKVVAPGVECTLADTADLSIKELNAIKDATLTFETDTGKVYILSHAWNESAKDLTDGGGGVSCVFAAMSCEEQLP